jgi:hypothetical protein
MESQDKKRDNKTMHQDKCKDKKAHGKGEAKQQDKVEKH